MTTDETQMSEAELAAYSRGITAALSRLIPEDRIEAFNQTVGEDADLDAYLDAATQFVGAPAAAENSTGSARDEHQAAAPAPADERQERLHRESEEAADRARSYLREKKGEWVSPKTAEEFMAMSRDQRAEFYRRDPEGFDAIGEPEPVWKPSAGAPTRDQFMEMSMDERAEAWRRYPDQVEALK
jgi:hypothetical protein